MSSAEQNLTNASLVEKVMVVHSCQENLLPAAYFLWDEDKSKVWNRKRYSRRSSERSVLERITQTKQRNHPRSS